jgi:hypothetical protein
MTRWFRFYDEALDDPKVQRLSPQLFKTWVNLLCLASKSDGKLPSDDDLAFRLRVSVQDAAQQIQDLILTGLIDIEPNGSRVPHGWQARQYASDSSAERMRKHRKNKSKNNGDVTCDVTVTPQIRTEQNRIESIGLPSSTSAAREVEDQKGFNNFFGMKDDRKKEKIVRRAEGLGLNIEELADACNRHKPRNRPAYFTSLCIQQIARKLPGASEDLIRSALWDKGDDAYAALIQLMVAA